MLFKVFFQLMTLIVFMLIGYFIKRKGIVGKNFDRDLSSFIINVTFPCFLIISMQLSFTPDRLRKGISLVILSLIMYVFIFIASKIILKPLHFNLVQQDMFLFLIMFTNCGFVGYPVMEAVFGVKAVFYGIIYNIPFNFLLFSLGIYIISDRDNSKPDIKKMLLNPCNIATFIGLTFFVLSIKIPTVIFEPMNTLGQLTIPLFMVAAGCILSNTSIAEAFKNRYIYFLSVIKLIVIPIIFGLFIIFINRITGMNIDKLGIGIAIIVSSMPSAVNGAVLTEQFGGDSKLAAQGVFITNLFSIATIPIIILCIEKVMLH